MISDPFKAVTHSPVSKWNGEMYFHLKRHGIGERDAVKAWVTKKMPTVFVPFHSVAKIVCNGDKPL